MSDELSRYCGRSVLPPGRALLPAVGVGATFTFIMTGLLLPALVAGVMTALTAWLVVPRSFWSGGLDMTTLSPADYSRWDHVRPFLPGGLAMVAGLLPGDGVVGDVPVWPFYFLGTTAAMLWAARAGGRRSGVVGRRRARVWKLAETLNRAEPEVHDGVVALHRQGVVGVSTIDAGEDTSRHLVEITPVGVRVMAELHRR